MFNRSGLIPPYSGNAGDGNTCEPELTTAELIREEIEMPVRNARAGALKDAVVYLTDNAINGAGHNVRAAINIRYFLPWTVVDELINEARPLVERETEKAKAARISIEQDQIRFENLVALFTAPGLQIQASDNRYNLLGLTESQLRLCADMLGTETNATNHG